MEAVAREAVSKVEAGADWAEAVALEEAKAAVEP